MRKTLHPFYLVAGLLLVLFLGARLLTVPNTNYPQIKKGILDLREWEFGRDGIVPLSGEWRFYWQQHLAPDNKFTATIPSEASIILAPKAWNGHRHHGTTIPRHGFGTYHLKVLIKPQQSRLALRILDMASSSRVYVNGNLVHTAGTTGETAATAVPGYAPDVVDFSTGSGEIDIMVHVTNYHHRLGGMWESMKLGNQQTITARREKLLLFDFFLMGCILVMGIYHICLICVREKDLSSLLFGVICLFVGIRMLSCGQRYLLQLIPATGYEGLLKIVYISFYLSVPLFTTYVMTLFPREFPKKVVLATQIAGLVATLLVLFTPARIFSFTMPVFQLGTIGLIIFTTGVIVLALKRKRRGSLVFLTGFLLLMITVLNDILYTRQIIDTRHLFQIRFLMFVLTQTYLLARRYAYFYDVIKQQSAELKAANADYAEELRQKKEVEQRLTASERFLSQIIDFLPDPTFVIDLKGKVLFWNRAIEKLTGFPAKRMVGQDNYGYAIPFYGDRRPVMVDLIRQWDAETAKKYVYVHEEDGILVSETAAPPLMYKGSHFWNVACPLSDENGQVIGAIETIRDITDIKRTEAELRKLNDNLEEKVAQRTAELQATSQFKSEFLAQMSHEIRTPLNGVIGSCELAQRESSRKKVLEYLDMINFSSKALLHIINDILDFSKIEAGKLDLTTESFVWRDVIEGVYDIFAPKLQNRNLELLSDFASDIPHQLVGDPYRLRQVLLNLVGNAVKFTQRGEIVIRVQKWKQDADSVELQFDVQDSGIGIPPELTQKLFKPFVQGITRDPNRPVGTGLGLSICKKIVHLMNGRIWLESRPDKGSTFSFTASFGVLPPGLPEVIEGPRRCDFAGLHVLIAVQNSGVRNMLKSIFQTYGCQPYTVRDAGEVMESLAAQPAKSIPFDVLVLEQDLAGIPGVDLVQKIRARYACDTLHVMMLCGYGAEPDSQELKSAGINTLIRKPVKYPQIARALASRGQGQGGGGHARAVISPAEKKSYGGRQVLLVEDHPINRRVAEAVLQSVDLTVTSVENGQQALDVLRSQVFDAVLMDLQMPIINGYDTTRKIRHDLNLNTLPIISMTASVTNNVKDECLRAGMDDYLTKPLDRQKLFFALDQAFGYKTALPN